MAAGAILFIEVPCRDFEHKDSDEPHLLFSTRSPWRGCCPKLGLSPRKCPGMGGVFATCGARRDSSTRCFVGSGRPPFVWGCCRSRLTLRRSRVGPTALQSGPSGPTAHQMNRHGGFGPLPAGLPEPGLIPGNRSQLKEPTHKRIIDMERCSVVAVTRAGGFPVG